VWGCSQSACPRPSMCSSPSICQEVLRELSGALPPSTSQAPSRILYLKLDRSANSDERSGSACGPNRNSTASLDSQCLWYGNPHSSREYKEDNWYVLSVMLEPPHTYLLILFYQGKPMMGRSTGYGTCCIHVVRPSTPIHKDSTTLLSARISKHSVSDIGHMHGTLGY
jgi:hypothetical protein